MRGDDQPSRYPPRGVWFGLFIAAWFAGVAPGQDSPDPLAGARSQNDPLVFSAERLWRWTEADGCYYLYLSGNSAALQGVDGVRARAVVAQIKTLSAGDEPLYRVEIYAEGDVQDTGKAGKPLARYRTSYQVAKVEMETYDPDGLKVLSTPPPPFGLLQRSGLLSRKASPKAAEAAVNQPPQAEAGSHIQPPISPRPTTPRQGPGSNRDIPTAAAPNTQAEPPAAFPLVGLESSSDSNQAGPGATTAGGRAVAAGLPDEGPATRGTGPKRDTMVYRASTQGAGAPGPDQGDGNRPQDDAPTPLPAPGGAQPPPIDLAPIESTPPGVPGIGVPNLRPNPEDQPPSIEALPGQGDRKGDEPETDVPPTRAPQPELLPIIPGTQRTTTLQARGGRELDFQRVAILPDGTEVYVARGGINIVTRAEKFGILDLEADEAVIWRGPGPEDGKPYRGPNNEIISVEDANKQPFEVYLEGNVIVRQDQRKLAGKGDQRTLRAPKVYYNILTDRFLAHDAEIDFFTQGLLAPYKVKSPRIEQFHPLIKQPDGTFKPDEHPQIRAERASMTGSRFPNPGYKVNMRTLDLTRYARPAIDYNSGKQLTNPGDPNPPEDLVWQMDSRQNFYYMGPVPAFFWPRVNTDLDDQQPPLRQFFFRTNNYFGQQLLTDWNGFRILQIKKPAFIDLWNVNLDYLSARTKEFPALGSEIGWFGQDLLRDLSDPYHRNRAAPETFTKDYFGYFDIWGLKDFGTDVLGTGPAIVTNGPPGAGKAGIQRSSVPPFQQDRGRLDFRHNQRFLPDDEDHQFEELRLQLEAAYYSDRYFLEEYYKRLHDVGMDQETLAYGIYQKNNTAVDVWTEANTMNWQTETQWLPRVDYYRLGDSLLSDWFTYYQHSGADYATINTDIMVNNPTLFAYMPYDPISNTTGTFSSGRFYTNHELDMPLKFFNALRLVPYVQGQLVGWSDQLGGGPLGHSPSGALGRAWGGVGMRAETTLYKKYPSVTSELMNVHGLTNKISLFADARAAFSNVRLNQLAIQDDLDDNTYEAVRRYLAITSFTGGILPMPYDPRHLILRQMVSPITGTTDVQAAIDTVSLGLHQRLQTKRGPIGKRRIVDYMTLDATSTYFPDSGRDNFSTPWGQTQYNYQWYIGDRTSIVSQGWFEFWKLVGSTPLNNNMVNGYNPNGLNIITSGISLQRPPRANIFLGYTIIDTGPIKTSALNTTISYWLSPKWYGTFSTSYDFGDAVDLGTMFSFTRIGADYLTTIGLSVDPQRMSYQFAIQMTPRMNGGFSMGSNAALSSFDTRFAPTQ